MKRKNYREIAAAICHAVEVLNSPVVLKSLSKEELAEVKQTTDVFLDGVSIVLAKNNPRFNSKIFVDACTPKPVI